MERINFRIDDDINADTTLPKLFLFPLSKLSHLHKYPTQHIKLINKQKIYD